MITALYSFLQKFSSYQLSETQRKQVVYFSFLMLVVTFTSGCSAIRGTEKSISHFVVSTNAEAQIGNQYHDQISQEYNIINDPQAQEWIDRMGTKLVETSPDSSLEYSFYITDAQEVNAFAIPGGHCYVNLGLIAYADNEAQVAAVVGHEINHVTQRHGVLQMQRQAGLNMALVSLESLVPGGAAQTAALMAGQAGSFAASRKFSRDDEREADKYGVRAMYEAGYDPREAAAFFGKLNELSAGQTPGWLQTIQATHPATTERIENINEQIQKYDLSSQQLTVNSPEFPLLQERLVSIYGSSSTETNYNSP